MRWAKIEVRSQLFPEAHCLQRWDLGQSVAMHRVVGLRTVMSFNSLGSDTHTQ